MDTTATDCTVWPDKVQSSLQGGGVADNFQTRISSSALGDFHQLLFQLFEGEGNRAMTGSRFKSVWSDIGREHGLEQSTRGRYGT